MKFIFLPLIVPLLAVLSGYVVRKAGLGVEATQQVILITSFFYYTVSYSLISYYTQKGIRTASFVSFGISLSVWLILIYLLSQPMGIG